MKVSIKSNHNCLLFQNTDWQHSYHELYAPQSVWNHKVHQIMAQNARKLDINTFCCLDRQFRMNHLQLDMLFKKYPLFGFFAEIKTSLAAA